MEKETGSAEPGGVERRPSEGIFLTGPVPTTLRPAIRAQRSLVSAGHYLAAIGGDRVFAQGGNAIDAGVAAAICLNVVQPDLTNFGGVAPIIVYESASGRSSQITGLGCFPRRATLEYFAAKYGDDLPIGIQTTVVPAAFDAYITALARFGTMSFEQVVGPALELAEEGFAVYPALQTNLQASKQRTSAWPSTRSVYLPQGGVPEVGEILRQRELAGLFRMLISAERSIGGDRRAGLAAARDLFYKGEIAHRMVRFIKDEGGVLELSDLAEFHVEVESAATVGFRGIEVHTCGPWCQGPVLAQMVGILDAVDLGAHASADSLHSIVEAMKLAYADREAYYGDPKFVDVPIDELLSPDYGRRQAGRIDPRRALQEVPEGGLGRRLGKAMARPVGSGGGAPPPGDTSYVCAMDSAGNGFSCTPSDGVGNTPLVPGLGIIVSDRGHQAWLDPTHPACVAPGKRPRLTPSPALATHGGRLLTVFGTPGGDVQPQAMLQVLLNMVSYGMDPQAAIEAPRVTTYSFPSSFFPHRSHPGSLFAEDRFSDETLADLRDRGHRLEIWPAWYPQAGAVCAIIRGNQHKTMLGGADPRRNNYAIGW